MASTAASSADIGNALANVYIGQRLEQYVSVSAACWFFWDHVITFDQEVQFIWCSKGWTLINVLFVVIRYGISIGYPVGLYVVFTRADSPNICAISDVFFFLFVLMGHLIQLVLGLRVWALYYRNRVVGAFLLAMFLALLGVSLNLSISYIKGGQAPIPPVAPGNPQLFGCLMNPIKGYYRTLVATTAFETLIVVLTIWKVLRHMRAQRNVPFINHFLSSGVSYYVAMLAMLVINLLTDPFPVLEIPILSSSCILIVQGVACCHIVLGMLRCASKLTPFTVPTHQSAHQPNDDATNTFFSIPAGIYAKEVMDDWEYGLPHLAMDDPIGSDDEGTVIPLETISSPVLEP